MRRSLTAAEKGFVETILAFRRGTRVGSGNGRVKWDGRITRLEGLGQRIGRVSWGKRVIVYLLMK